MAQLQCRRASQVPCKTAVSLLLLPSVLQHLIDSSNRAGKHSMQPGRHSHRLHACRNGTSHAALRKLVLRLQAATHQSRQGRSSSVGLLVNLLAAQPCALLLLPCYMQNLTQVTDDNRQTGKHRMQLGRHVSVHSHRLHACRNGTSHAALRKLVLRLQAATHQSRQGRSSSVGLLVNLLAAQPCALLLLPCYMQNLTQVTDDNRQTGKHRMQLGRHVSVHSHRLHACRNGTSHAAQLCTLLLLPCAVQNLTDDNRRTGKPSMQLGRHSHRSHACRNGTSRAALRMRTSALDKLWWWHSCMQHSAVQASHQAPNRTSCTRGICFLGSWSTRIWGGEAKAN